MGGIEERRRRQRSDPADPDQERLHSRRGANLRDFAVFVGEDLDHVWGNCEGYPAKGASRDFDGFWAYAKKYQLTTHAFYNAYPGLSVPRIHQLAAFKDLFDAFVARTRDGDGRSIDGLAEAFDQFV